MNDATRREIEQIATSGTTDETRKLAKAILEFHGPADPYAGMSPTEKLRHMAVDDMYAKKR